MAEKHIAHFKTNVQLKSIIGKDLINDDNIAILELVKNAFDAGGNIVTVGFLNITDNDDEDAKTFSSNTSRIIIADDGIGMNLSDVENKWLNIAYSDKKINSKQNNRRMAGAKGVGRFSCDRLGRYLNLYSRTLSKDNSPSYIKLTIDWSKFEVQDENKEIQSIPLEYEYLNDEKLIEHGFTPFEHGVILEIIKLRSVWTSPIIKRGYIEDWDTKRILNVRKYLEKLINPNQIFEANEFGIYIEAPELEEINEERSRNEQFLGKVENRIFDKLDFKTTSIETEIINDGQVIFTTLKDKGETVFWIKEKNIYYPQIKDVKINVYYLNTYAKAFFAKQTGITSIDYGSVFLFVNGFRIPPYGDSGNDWLAIDQRKAQGTRRYLGTRDIIGQIEINDESNDFQIISSREGLVHNNSFSSLTRSTNNESYFYRTLRRLERYVVEGLNWDSTIYDSRGEEDNKKFREIEAKIIAGKSTEDDLKYREDFRTKQRRIYYSIQSIISARPNDVLELYINENLITEKIEEERKAAEKEFAQLIDDFENKKIDGDILNKILLNKAQQNEELRKQIESFSRYSVNEATSRAIAELQEYRNLLATQENTILKLKEELESAKGEAEETKRELEEAKSQNLFLKSVRSQDLDDLVNLMHHIGISTGVIQNFMKGYTVKLENNLPIEADEIKTIFTKINYELNKIQSISRFATRANFKLEATPQTINIIQFIEEYIMNIVKPFITRDIQIIIYEHDIKEFITTFKPLELIIAIDNLISNSRKAISAQKEKSNSNYSPRIEITFSLENSDKLNISFKDNGIGIDESIKDKIFEFGFTTTEGSGLGLTHVQELMKNMNGEISYDKTYSGGANFILTFNKD